MPELPEVQTIVNDLLAANICNIPIIKASVFWDKTVAPLSARHFITQIKNKSIKHIRRRAKYIIMELSEGLSLVIHLRMTGQFRLITGEQREKHEHVVFSLQDGRQLCYRDVRKFGRLILTDNPEAMLAHLGPEPLEAVALLGHVIDHFR